MLNPFKNKHRQKPHRPTPQWLKWGVLGFIVLILLINSQAPDGEQSPLDQAMDNISGTIPSPDDYTKLIPTEIKNTLSDVKEGEGRMPLCGQTLSVAYTAYHAEDKVTGGDVELVNMPGGDMPRLQSLVAGMQVGGVRRVDVADPVTIGYFIADDAPEPISAFEVTLNKAAPDVSGLFDENALGIKLFDEQPGEGKLAMCGDAVTVSYRAHSGAGGAPTSGEVAFVIGNGEVMAGLEQGVIGMQPGAKRTLVLPHAWQQHLYQHPKPYSFSPHPACGGGTGGANCPLMILEITRSK